VEAAAERHLQSRGGPWADPEGLAAGREHEVDDNHPAPAAEHPEEVQGDPEDAYPEVQGDLEDLEDREASAADPLEHPAAGPLAVPEDRADAFREDRVACQGEPAEAQVEAALRTADAQEASADVRQEAQDSHHPWGAAVPAACRAAAEADLPAWAAAPGTRDAAQSPEPRSSGRACVHRTSADARTASSPR
jgi:hypothetical protein